MAGSSATMTGKVETKQQQPVEQESEETKKDEGLGKRLRKRRMPRAHADFVLSLDVLYQPTCLAEMDIWTRTVHGVELTREMAQYSNELQEWVSSELATKGYVEVEVDIWTRTATSAAVAAATKTLTSTTKGTNTKMKMTTRKKKNKSQTTRKKQLKSTNKLLASCMHLYTYVDKTKLNMFT